MIKMQRGIRFITTFLTTMLLLLIGIDKVSSQTVWLDELDLSSATQGYGLPAKNKSVEGHPLTIGGQTFNRGFGTHARKFFGDPVRSKS